MNKIKTLFLSLPLAAILSCAHVLPVVECAEPAVVAIIENDFSSGNWESAVVADLEKYGPSVVDCVVNQIISEATKKGNVGDSDMVTHAKAWKASHSNG
jgi:hypothetical protein